MAQVIILDLDVILFFLTAEDIGDDVRQFVRRHVLLSIAELDDPRGHFRERFLIELDAEFLQILGNARLAGALAERIFPKPPEAFGREPVAIKVILDVAVRVNTAGLREHVLADDRLVARDPYARKSLDDLADLAEGFLVDRHLDRLFPGQVILKNADHRRKRRVSGPLSEPVHRRMHAAGSAADRLQ